MWDKKFDPAVELLAEGAASPQTRFRLPCICGHVCWLVGGADLLPGRPAGLLPGCALCFVGAFGTGLRRGISWPRDEGDWWDRRDLALGGSAPVVRPFGWIKRRPWPAQDGQKRRQRWRWWRWTDSALIDPENCTEQKPTPGESWLAVRAGVLSEGRGGGSCSACDGDRKKNALECER